MGLLDVFNSYEGQQGLGLLAAASARSDGAGFGQRLQEGLGAADQWKTRQAKMAQEAQMAEFQKMQMQEHMQRINDANDLRSAATRAFISPERANAMSMGPMEDGSNVPEVKSGFNDQQYIQNLQGLGRPMEAMQYQAAIQKQAPKMTVVAPGASLVNELTGKAAYTSPKEFNKPAEQQGYELAKTQGYPGSFIDYQLALKKAGATSVSMRVDNKIGESLAGQVGPMAKDSRIQTQAAVKMFDSADRLEKALDSNKVTSGPLATQIQTAKQLIQVVGGGNDDGIRQTRQAIKSLAQMAVEARKQLQGQGQVTESEAAAVAKADAGDLNDLTTGELRDLVTLTKRASYFQAKTHTELLGSLGSKPETQGLVPFYGVQGLDTLLKHSPALPQIGGGGWEIKQVGQ
jgi:hypothetical protein